MAVRVVDLSEEKAETKPRYRAFFAGQPAEYPYVRKVVLCFLPVDRRPVVFFGMIVHEYGDDCPPPNAKVRLSPPKGRGWASRRLSGGFFHY